LADILFFSTETFPVNGLQLYGKNVTMAFGRCPVRSIFEDALALLVQEHKKLLFLTGEVRDLETAPEAYRAFNAMEVGKVCFKITKRGE
jgi:threonine dehydrogenase-like Zn-dependent dehydrogenase